MKEEFKLSESIRQERNIKGSKNSDQKEERYAGIEYVKGK
jgi:hypothetical protein